MLYMVGANLESNNGLATEDLKGIKYSLMDNENLNVVLIAGGSKEWNNSIRVRKLSTKYSGKWNTKFLRYHRYISSVNRNIDIVHFHLLQKI